MLEIFALPPLSLYSIRLSVWLWWLVSWYKWAKNGFNIIVISKWSQLYSFPKLHFFKNFKVDVAGLG